jgi:hypothetical protein
MNVFENYTPRWSVGQSWKVEMGIPLDPDLVSGSRLPSLEVHALTYTVERLAADAKDSTVIRVRHMDEAADPGYRVYLRVNPISIAKVTKVGVAGEEDVLENGSHVCYTPHMSMVDLVWDFPVFPLAAGAGRSTGVFYHKTEVREWISQERDTVIVRWELRLKGISYEAIQTWTRGRPWFMKTERFQVDLVTGERVRYAYGEYIP